MLQRACAQRSRTQSAWARGMDGLCLKPLLAWAHGTGLLHPALTVASGPHGLHVQATEPIAEGTALVSVPASLLVTAERARSSARAAAAEEREEKAKQESSSPRAAPSGSVLKRIGFDAELRRGV